MRIGRKVRPRCLAVALLLGLGLGPATAQLLGPEFRINSYTANHQTLPAVAADGAGNFVVVWDSNLQDGSAYGVFGQQFNSAGFPAGEFRVNSYTTDSQAAPAVAADGLGNFVVTWSSYAQDGSGWGVFGQRFDSAGFPAGSAFQVNSTTASDQSIPAVAKDGSGNFVVVWSSYLQDGSNWGVFGKRFNSAGVPAGEFGVNTYTTSQQFIPAVAADGAGNFVVVWQSSLQDGSGFGVFGQRFNSAGFPAGSEFRVNSYTTNSQRRPAVAIDGAGNFVVVWQSYLQDGSGYGLFGQRFSSAGSPTGSEFQVNSYTTGRTMYPAVAADGAGSFVVVWQSDGQDGSSWGVFGQQFSSAGFRVGSEFQVNSYTTLEQQNPAVVADGAGNFVVAWESTLQDGSGYGVFGKRSTALFSDGFELGDACAWSVAVGGGCP